MLIARLPAATIKETDGSLVHRDGINGGSVKPSQKHKGSEPSFVFFRFFPTANPFPCW